ncbi:MAG: alpha/beta hydrolase [Alphaproteobacteria bacterium]|nr:alpha/beta hydrolase [Alphaproteobacteria bacterium]MBT5860969.1 alpha/beta hydrolase [Alphaproteobacteria bacterium]
MTDDIVWAGEPGSGPVVVLAHGAGAAIDSPFMEFFANELAAGGLPTGRFEFPYMRRRRAEGTKRPPDRAPVLMDAWRSVIAGLGDDGIPPSSIIIGGKSMGGRIATMVASDTGVRGLVCLGYPFHPPGRPEKTRVEHLADMATPMLVVQGTRDSLGSQDDVKGYDLSAKISLAWMEDGDHSFKPRKASGRTEDQNWRDGVDAVLDWVKSLDD